MAMRGVQKTSATTVTKSVLGCFGTGTGLRGEFYSLLGLRVSTA